MNPSPITPVNYQSSPGDATSAFISPLPARVTSAARAAAEAWASAMQQKRQPCVMAPWDESLYCLNPVITKTPLTAGVTSQIAASNPQRVGIIFSPGSIPAGNTWIQPLTPIDGGSPSGILLPNSGGHVAFTQKDWLNLVQMAWFGYAIPAGQSITTIEIVLKDWPKR